jgi:23S rRNA pseudouridine955/2504/2580 synthase
LVDHVIVTVEESDQRLDRWFKRRFPGLPQSRLQKLLRTGQVRVDGKRVEAAHRVASGETIRIPPGIEAAPPESAREVIAGRDAQFMESLVIHRDDQVIALNKPPGLAVQGGTNTLRHIDGMLDALAFGGERPRLVHRLDRDTSGVLLLARSARAAARLAEAFRRKDTEKTYLALVIGRPRPPKGRIEFALGRSAADPERVVSDAEGKPSATLYDTIETAGDRVAVLRLNPLTGRTHQLRVHCAEGLGCPVVGDTRYGGERHGLGDAVGEGMHLHAAAIALPHPSGRGVLRVVAKLPAHMLKTWRYFGFDPDPLRGD